MRKKNDDMWTQAINADIIDAGAGALMVAVYLREERHVL
jgi:hypothetical protein